MSEAKFYHDTDSRMAADHDFRAAVHAMMNMANQCGFTPGELKQIAFRAALELELRRPGCHVLTEQQLVELEEANKRRVSPSQMEHLVGLIKSGALARGEQR